MGQLVIEVPQNINLKFSVKSAEIADEILRLVKKPNEKLDFAFLKWVWDYPNRTKPKVESLLKKFQNEKTIFRLKSENDVENFFINLETNNVKSPEICF